MQIMAKRHFSPLALKCDFGHNKREKACQVLNQEIRDVFADREAKAREGLVSESKITLGPGKGKAQKLAEANSYGTAEHSNRLGSHWRNIVDMGMQTQTNAKAIGRYQRPEPITVQHGGKYSGTISGSYRNQSGDLVKDMFQNRFRSRAEYKREKRKFRKVIDGLAIANAIKADNSVLIEIDAMNQAAKTTSSTQFVGPALASTKRKYSWER